MSDEDIINVQSSYIDSITGYKVVKVIAGQYHVSSSPKEVLMTNLGSCIAACIRDPFAGVGGLNHFLLPDGNKDSVSSDSTRYGVFAMEELVNAILNRGGQKACLEVKIFGGGNVIKSSNRIGSKNVEFIRKYLSNEGLMIASEDVGGNYPRRIHYYPVSGKVMMKKIASGAQKALSREEEQYQQSLKEKISKTGNVELF